jgi:hypothetical protein
MIDIGSFFTASNASSILSATAAIALQRVPVGQIDAVAEDPEGAEVLVKENSTDGASGFGLWAPAPGRSPESKAKPKSGNGNGKWQMANGKDAVAVA